MYSTKDLTNIILEIRKTNAIDSDLLLKLLDIIEDLYKQDEWVIFPITYNENEDKLFCITQMQIGTCLIMLSDEKYFNNNYGKDVVMTSIRKGFDAYFNSSQLDGIVINPGTDAQIFLQKQVIETLNLQK